MQIGHSRTAIAEAPSTAGTESEVQLPRGDPNFRYRQGLSPTTMDFNDETTCFQAETLERTERFGDSECALRESNADQIAEHYEQAAGEYRVWSPEGYLHAGLWQPGINPFHRREMLEAANHVVFNELALGELPHGLVVDLGCGYGAVANHGATLFPNLDWLGVSLSDHQIETGRRTVSPRVKLWKSDYHSLDLSEGSVSAAYFLESFCYSYDPRGLFSEMRRLLIPGQRLTIVDGMLRRPWSSIRGLPRWLANQAARGWAINEFPEVNNTLRHAKDAGLELINIREVGIRTWPNMMSVPWLVGQRFWANRSFRSLHSDTKVDPTSRSRNRKHLVACLSGAAMSLFRSHFGYYILTWKRP